MTPEDLILSKLVWAKESNSELQLLDVRLMLQSVNEFDNDYLQKWSDEMGVAELLKKARENE